MRIIRHRATGLGRGFGYINFETSEGAVLALSLNGTEISNRKIRVQSITGQEAAKKKQQQQKTPEKGGKRKHQTENESNNSPKRVKTENSETVERAVSIFNEKTFLNSFGKNANRCKTMNENFRPTTASMPRDARTKGKNVLRVTNKDQNQTRAAQRATAVQLNSKDKLVHRRTKNPNRTRRPKKRNKWPLSCSRNRKNHKIINNF